MDVDGQTLGLTPGSAEPEKGRRGRPKGIPNRATRDVREAARKYTARALTTLAKLLADPDPKVRAIAAKELLDRAHGRPMTPTELTGKDGEPLHPPREMTDTDIARTIAFVLTKADREGMTPSQAAAAQRAVAAFEARGREPAAQDALARQPGPTAPILSDELLAEERARNEELREQLSRPDQSDQRQSAPKVVRFPRRDR
ncbi:MAG: hypothetical protein ACOY7L_08420 [Pseudomonadota bacterium]